MLTHVNPRETKWSRKTKDSFPVLEGLFSHGGRGIWACRRDWEAECGHFFTRFSHHQLRIDSWDKKPCLPTPPLLACTATGQCLSETSVFCFALYRDHLYPQRLFVSRFYIKYSTSSVFFLVLLCVFYPTFPANTFNYAFYCRFPLCICPNNPGQRSLTSRGCALKCYFYVTFSSLGWQ